MELLRDFNCSIIYHPDKVNVVPDTLNIKSAGSFAHINTKRGPIIKELQDLIDQEMQLKVTNKFILS